MVPAKGATPRARCGAWHMFGIGQTRKEELAHLKVNRCINHHTSWSQSSPAIKAGGWGSTCGGGRWESGKEGGCTVWSNSAVVDAAAQFSVVMSWWPLPWVMATGVCTRGTNLTSYASGAMAHIGLSQYIVLLLEILSLNVCVSFLCHACLLRTGVKRMAWTPLNRSSS